MKGDVAVPSPSERPSLMQGGPLNFARGAARQMYGSKSLRQPGAPTTNSNHNHNNNHNNNNNNHNHHQHNHRGSGEF